MSGEVPSSGIHHANAAMERITHLFEVISQQPGGENIAHLLVELRREIDTVIGAARAAGMEYVFSLVPDPHKELWWSVYRGEHGF